ncbi:hypothetical protein [Ferviditalea candida]|uniref:Uncharacterized protein n=1 Tax=Ferviditalea candida TaxID=3108399 RepID=A0ABU5ZE03_9BACL|nr:hypothetical protein [Paenibacillaceae bacterium T2]
MRKMSKAALVICCIFAAFLQEIVHADPSKPEARITLIVKSSPDSAFHSNLTIYSESILKAILDNGIHKKTNHKPISDTYLIAARQRWSKTYRIDSFANLFDEQFNETIEPPPFVKEKLSAYIDLLRRSHYGKKISWNEANHMIAKKSKFSVIDLETGLRFQVQRRAGSSHADVQPLTKQDTAIMKKIYQGKWSWKRRAILVQKDNQFFAASMNGMPHGGDGIPNNDFRGHFCIHFLNSATHGSGNVDLTHQLMVYKAAGKLQEYIEQASPYEIVDTFFIAVNQQDLELMKMMFLDLKDQQFEWILQRRMNNIKAIRKISNHISNYDEEEWENLLSVPVPVTVSIYQAGGGEQKLSFIFQLKRFSLTDPWKIDFIETDPFTLE